MLERRDFIRLLGAGGLTAVALPVLDACSTADRADPIVDGSAPATGPATGPSPDPFNGYGPLTGPDELGLLLPAGFAARLVAETGTPVENTDFVWPEAPDGGATFATDDGWIYVSNSEAPEGGASMIRFGSDGAILEARSILDGTIRNCAGGATPWQTWLSCEEYPGGRVWECDPTGLQQAEVRPAMGVCNHEAAACDPQLEVVYLTEDEPTGALYRFRPDSWGDLTSGTLAVLVSDGGRMRWEPVTDPSASEVPLREQVPGTVAFDGGEGAAVQDEVLWFSTKGDNRIWRLDPVGDDEADLEVVWDQESHEGDVAIDQVDNVVIGPNDLPFVAEDGDGMQLVVLDPDGQMHQVVVATGEGESEITGPAFSPDGTRLYFSSQRNPGRTFEVTGPFGG